MTPSANDLCFMSITELSRLIKDRVVSPVEVTNAMLDRVERHNEQMRVYITITRDVALEQARQAEQEIMTGQYRGPLHGVTVSLKDNVSTKGIRTSCASTVNPDWVPDEDAGVYERLRAAGAILIGKANLYEYAFSMNPAFPNPLNPWNPERTSAGSSSGSGAGVAAGMTHGSIGSDTGGSGRSPANANGAVGFKATYGRVSRYGLFPLSYSLDHTSVMTRRVHDSALMLQAVSGHDPRDENSAQQPVPDFSAKIGRDIRGLRLGLAKGYSVDIMHSDISDMVANAVEVFRSQGAIVEEVELPYIRLAGPIHGAVMYPEAAAIHYDTLRKSGDKLGEMAVTRLDIGNVLPATVHVQGQRARKFLRDAYRDLMRQYDAIIGPASPMLVGPADAWTFTTSGRPFEGKQVGPEYTGIYNLTGLPALVLPGGFNSDGMPMGLQVAGRWFDEATVLQVAHAFEQATEWHTRRPPHPVE